MNTEIPNGVKMLNFKTNVDWLKDDVERANTVVPELIERLKKLGEYKFKLSDITAIELAEMFEKSNATLEVKTYWYYSRNVIGKFVPSQPLNIWLNRKAQPRGIEDNVATMIHEGVHYLDSLTPKYFGHADNKYKKWKENTAPFYADNLAEQIVLGFDVIQTGTNTNIVTRPTLWSRIKSFFRRVF